MKSIMILLLLVFAPLAMAQKIQFSAEIVNTERQGGTSKSRIFVGAGKVSVDGMGGQPSTFIGDLSTLSAYMLMSKERAYREMKLDDPKAQMLNSLFLFTPANPRDPCAQWRKEIPDLTCKKVGTENLNGHSTEKWAGTRTHGEKGWLWFDPQLQFSIKLDTHEGIIEFRNILEGHSSSSSIQSSIRLSQDELTYGADGFSFIS